jgi:hypothetical protein
MTVTATGTTTSLAVNCGPLAGQIATPGSNAGVAGTALRQIILTSTVGNAYLLPRGSTAAGNPGNILAYLPKDVPVAIPYGQPFEGGILPENFCLDADTSSTIVYGCGIIS